MYDALVWRARYWQAKDNGEQCGIAVICPTCLRPVLPDSDCPDEAHSVTSSEMIQAHGLDSLVHSLIVETPDKERLHA